MLGRPRQAVSEPGRLSHSYRIDNMPLEAAVEYQDQTNGSADPNRADQTARLEPNAVASRPAPQDKQSPRVAATKARPARERRQAYTERPAAFSGPDVAAQRARFGGFKLAAAFFGWLVATGMAVLLTGIATAAGAAFALSQVANVTRTAQRHASTIGIAGGAALVVIVVMSYLTGGYVAGRLARFDGVRQGFGVWVIGIVLTAAFAIAGWLFGSDYNVLNRLDLPNIPLSHGNLTTGGVVALAAGAGGALIAALLGGKLGTQYHRKIDRAAPERHAITN